MVVVGDVPQLADRIVEPVGQRLGEPLGGHRVGLRGQRPGLATEVLGQLVEGADIEPPGPFGHVARVVREVAREIRHDCNRQVLDGTAGGVLRRKAELYAEAGLPDGVFTVVHGDKEAVDALLDVSGPGSGSPLGPSSTASTARHGS